MASMVGVAALLVFVFVLAVAPAYATDYTVGDGSGWTTGVDYATWASGKKFVAGDTLLFTYGPTHTADQVNKADYDACSASKPIQAHNDGNTKITLSSGTTYYICGVSSHCNGGMKLTVTVADSTPTTPTTPSTPSTPGGSTPTPTTPGGSPPSTPSSPTPPTKSNAVAAGGNAALGGALLLGFALLA